MEQERERERERSKGETDVAIKTMASPINLWPSFPRFTRSFADVG